MYLTRGEMFHPRMKSPREKRKHTHRKKFHTEMEIIPPTIYFTANLQIGGVNKWRSVGFSLNHAVRGIVNSWEED